MEVSGHLDALVALSSGKKPIGWVGPRAGLDTMLKRKIPSPMSGLEPPII
jgi:hypothetical protein